MFFLILFLLFSTTSAIDVFVTKMDLHLEDHKVTNSTSAWNYKPLLFPLREEAEWNQKIPGTYIIEFKNASICKREGIVLLRDKIYKDSLWAWSAVNKAPNEFTPPEQIIEIDKTVATIALEGSLNYYHWMVEVLPRLHLLNLVKAEYDYLYVSALKSRFQKETLEILNVDFKKIIEADRTTHIKPKKLIFPSQAARSCVSPKWVIEFLQKTFLEDYKVKDGKKRIFISRKNGSIRYIINEDNIFDLIKPFGFEKVFMEKLSVKEQAELTHESEIIIGTHGAGMTNIVFARPGTTVIELFQEHLDETFFELSPLLQLDYHCIKTERIIHLSQEDVDTPYRNTFIDEKAFKKDIMEIFNQLNIKTKI